MILWIELQLQNLSSHNMTYQRFCERPHKGKQQTIWPPVPAQTGTDHVTRMQWKHGDALFGPQTGQLKSYKYITQFGIIVCHHAPIFTRLTWRQPFFTYVIYIHCALPIYIHTNKQKNVQIQKRYIYNTLNKLCSSQLNLHMQQIYAKVGFTIRLLSLKETYIPYHIFGWKDICNHHQST